ncbi:hypothetical protein G6F68_015764 [Rhizopus microsporus]|nr:hypothetical protein G6F68_015764 [Rhizopus microsporus]
MKRGQPYVGAFLLKEEGLETDTITNINEVHQIGVFAQITSVFSSSTGKEDGGLTAVLYPHRRIKMNELLTIKHQERSVAAAEDVSSKEAEKSKDQSRLDPEKAAAGMQ